MRLAPGAPRRFARMLVATVVLAVGLSGCGSDQTIVRTVTVERSSPSPALADADGDGSADATETATTSTTATTTMPAEEPLAAGYQRCDANITAKKATTTCGFATNAFHAYWTSERASRIRVFSPATQRMFSAECSIAGDEVECTTSDDGAARFSKAAVDDYSQTQADSYAADHDVGPEAASSGGGTPTPRLADPPPPTSSTDSFCDTHDCIPNYDNGNGSTVQCSDGTYSQSGGIRGACSHHGGVG